MENLSNSLTGLAAVVSTVVQEVGKAIAYAFGSKNFASNLVVSESTGLVIAIMVTLPILAINLITNLETWPKLIRSPVVFPFTAISHFRRGRVIPTRVLPMSWIGASCSTIKLARTTVYIGGAIMTENTPLAEPTYHTPIGINSYNDYSVTTEGLATTSTK